MSASMSNTEIPSQHIRLGVCATRPAYRDGRNPKAVKVFTINQESRYLLFQGVPAMGTTQQLIRLCAIHGEVEEYHMLDEFPSADQFTDVVLVKFKRIVSARHAKKKLDDWSFFGGTLHVSYAPEYESVEETRQKLQERRKAIAGRLRLLGKDQSRKKKETQENSGQSQGGTENVSNKGRQRIECRIPSLPGSGQSNINNDSNTTSKPYGQNGERIQHNFSHNSKSDSNTNSNPYWQNSERNQNFTHNSNDLNQYGCQIQNQGSFENRNFTQTQILCHTNNSVSSSTSFHNHTAGTDNVSEGQNWKGQPGYSGFHGYDTSHHSFTIPPPPMREPFPNYSRINNSQQKQNYDFARVPTANAPYPPNFDARIGPDIPTMRTIDSSVSTDKLTDSVNAASHTRAKTNSAKTNSSTHHEPHVQGTDNAKHKVSEPHKKLQNLSHPKYQKLVENSTGQGEKVIIKEFKKSGQVPKFIPRQMLSVTKAKPAPVQTSVVNNDELSKQLRKNAVVLGSTQGPAEVPEEYKKPEQLPTESAVEKTVTEIRKRVSEFSAGPSVNKRTKKDN